jgi:hypothetical protein
MQSYYIWTIKVMKRGQIILNKTHGGRNDRKEETIILNRGADINAAPGA